TGNRIPSVYQISTATADVHIAQAGPLTGFALAETGYDVSASPSGPVSLPASRRSASAARLLAVLVAGLLVLGPQPGATAADTNIAVGSEATASSVENAGTPASAAVDGDQSTRWSSGWSDPQWLLLDLGANAAISGFA